MNKYKKKILDIISHTNYKKINSHCPSKTLIFMIVFAAVFLCTFCSNFAMQPAGKSIKERAALFEKTKEKNPTVPQSPKKIAPTPPTKKPVEKTEIVKVSEQKKIIPEKNTKLTTKKSIEKIEQIDRVYFSEILNKMKLSVLPGEKSQNSIQIDFDAKDLNFSENFIKYCIKEIHAGQINACKEDLDLVCKFLNGFDEYTDSECEKEYQSLHQDPSTTQEPPKCQIKKCPDGTISFYVKKIIDSKRPIVSIFEECHCMHRVLRELFENKIMNIDVIKKKKTINYMSIGSGNLFQDLSLITKLIEAGKKIDTINIIDLVYGKQEDKIKRESIVKALTKASKEGIGYINNEKNTSQLFLPVAQLAQFAKIISEIQKYPVKVIIHENFYSYETLCKEQPSKKADLAVAIDFSSIFSIKGFGVSEQGPKVSSESNTYYKVIDKFDEQKCEYYDINIEETKNKKMHQKNEKLFVRILDNTIGKEGVFGTIRKKTDEGWEEGQFFETIFIKK